MRDKIDQVYTFPIKHSEPGYNVKNSLVLINHHNDGTATVILNNPPGRSAYHNNYPNASKDDPERQARTELANDLVEYAETVLSEYDPRTSSWTSNSGNRSLRDIYVEVDDDEVDDVVVKMWQILVEFKQRYIDYLREYEPEKLVSPDGPLKQKVENITGGLDQPYTHDLGDTTQIGSE